MNPPGAAALPPRAARRWGLGRHVALPGLPWWLPVLLIVLLAPGCASLGTPAPGDAPVAAGLPSGTDGRTAGQPAEAGATAAPAPPLGVQVQIVAPEKLRALLERHLDVVRLGRMAREEVDDSEWSRLIAATPNQVKELLQTEGYFTPVVSLERQPRRAAGEPDIVLLRVDPGPQAHVTRVTLEAEGDLERAAAAGDPYAREVLDRWRAEWTLPAGSAFRNPDWGQAKAGALARLRAAGYATANWTGTAADVDVARHEVRIFVVIDSGPLFRFGELQIDGLTTHDAETVRWLADAHRGTPVSETLLLDFQERLQKSRLFESVTVTLDADPARADDASIVVRLREAPEQTYVLGVGVSANTGFRVSLDHVYRRVFGFAAMADNKFELAQKRRAWDGEISTHPGAGLYRNLFGGAIEWLQSDSDETVSQRLRLGRTRDRAQLEQLYFAEAERSKRTTALDSTSTVGLSVNYHAIWRQVDSVILPTEGYTFAGQAGVGRSHGSASESGWFTRAYGRFTGYLPFGGSWYGQGRLEVGQVFVGPNVVAPESQRWRAGGDDSVRGYAYRSLGPLDADGVVESGNAVLTTSLELARPVSENLPSVWGAVFVDAGQAANSFSAAKLALGYGVGVRWRSPVGPLRLDWAYGEEVKSWRLHFSIGIVY
jgi:translocation and assembly module TamA